jgi:hypothetical protein
MIAPQFSAWPLPSSKIAINSRNKKALAKGPQKPAKAKETIYVSDKTTTVGKRQAELSPFWRMVIESPVSRGPMHLWLVLYLRRDKKTGKAFPSLSCLESDLGCKRNNIRTWATQLEEKGWLKVERPARRGEGSNIYIPLDGFGEVVPVRILPPSAPTDTTPQCPERHHGSAPMGSKGSARRGTLSSTTLKSGKNINEVEKDDSASFSPRLCYAAGFCCG